MHCKMDEEGSGKSFPGERHLSGDLNGKWKVRRQNALGLK